MIVIELGREGRRQREERFADGALVVRSSRGLPATGSAMLHALPRGKSGSALVVNSAEAVTGMALRALNPELSVHGHFDDAWDLAMARRTVAEHPDLAPTLEVAADPPDGPWHLVVVPFEQDEETALVRERVRGAVGWLRPGGLLYASVGTPRERFVRDEVKAAFGSMTIVPAPSRRGGTVYIARRPKEPRGPKKAGPTTFTVREGERELAFVSRPGVFCHGRLDPGTRALLSVMEVGEAKRILDLGCGVGVIGIVAALRGPNARVTMVDSNARGVQCAKLNLESNGLAERCEVVLSADALNDVEPGCDLVLTNPPYYSRYRVAEMFLATAKRVLAPGGRLTLVTKGPEWYLEHMQELFGNVGRETRGGYAVLTSAAR